MHPGLYELTCIRYEAVSDDIIIGALRQDLINTHYDQMNSSFDFLLHRERELMSPCKSRQSEGRLNNVNANRSAY